MSNPVSRRTIVAGNWKHGPLRDDGLALARDVARGAQLRSRSDLEIVLFPPSPYWGAVEPNGFRLGAQDADAVDLGAFTGAVGGELAKSFGVTSVLVGHSERRREFGDDDAACRSKLDAVVSHGLEPFLCVGETLEERERDETFGVVERQLEIGLGGFGSDGLGGDSPLVVAYEPVWAIGTGRTATPEQAAEVHVRIRAWLGSRFGEEFGRTIPILYGGSVKPENAGELLAAEDIDGALVGGASLKSESFLGIVDAIPAGRE